MLRTTLFALMLSTVALPAVANDTMAELKTGGLAFVRTTDISMEEEKLYISPKEVRVDYVFRNTSDRAIESVVAFPMPPVGGGPAQNIDAGNSESDNFLNFSVVQDGKPIKPTLQQRVIALSIDMTDIVKAENIPLHPLGQNTAAALEKLSPETRKDWLARGLIMVESWDDGSGMKDHLTPLWELQSVYYWRSSFPPGQDVHVSHTYHPSVGGTVQVSYLEEGEPKGAIYDEYVKKYCIDDTFVKIGQKSRQAMIDEKPYYYENWISYVLTTGANWLGPIKKFTLVVDKGNEENYVSFCGEGVRKTGPTTFEMTKTDFWPDRDLDLLLLIPNEAP